VQGAWRRDLGEPLATKASVPKLHDIAVLARRTVCVGAALARRRRRVASRRIDDEASAAASRAVDTWENEGGSISAASDATGDRPRQNTGAVSE
jgi:hypothetical protein